MKNQEGFNQEEVIKIREAIKNDDVETFKNLIAYDSLSQLAKRTWMGFYDDMVKTCNQIRSIYAGESTAESYIIGKEYEETLVNIRHSENRNLN